MFLQGGGQCFSSLSQEPSVKGLRCSWLPGLGVGGGLQTAVAQVKTLAWPQESLHRPHPPAFMARMHNLPLQN